MKRLALLLRGITYVSMYRHHTGSIYEIDYRRNLDKLKSQLINPLKSRFDVDVYLTTYKSEINQDTIINDFAPCKGCIMLEPSQHDQVSCLINGLNRILDTHELYDFVIISRFDLNLLTDLQDLKWNLEKINFLWHENTNAEQTADCMFFLNFKFISIFIQVLTNSIERTSMHNLKQQLLQHVKEDDIHVMFKQTFNSNSDKGTNPVYEIVRHEITPRNAFAYKFLSKKTKYVS